VDERWLVDAADAEGATNARARTSSAGAATVRRFMSPRLLLDGLERMRASTYLRRPTAF
jgi:hypothetical protein